MRNKYKDYESTSYTYTIDNFNPFLQSQLGKQENLPVNSLGFRGEEISPIKPKGTYRIFVLGGSTVLDREVPFEKSAVRLLEKKLRERFPQKHIEVINAGKDYYTTEHSLIQYMFKIQDLQPDLIIMWHGTNDIVASCLSEGVVTHGEYKSDYSHLFGAVSSIVYNYFRPAPIIQIKLVSIDFLFKAMKDNLYSDFTQKIQQKSREQMARDYMNNKNTITVHDFPSINAYRRNLMYLIQFAKLHQTPLLLGNQPSLFKENNSLEEVEAIMYPRIACEKDGKFYSLESLRYAQDMFNVETKKIAQDQDVYFVDLDNAVPKSLKYFLDAPHYTEQGNEKVAQALFDSLVGYGMIN